MRYNNVVVVLSNEDNGTDTYTLNCHLEAPDFSFYFTQTLRVAFLDIQTKFPSREIQLAWDLHIQQSPDELFIQTGSI